MAGEVATVVVAAMAASDEVTKLVVRNDSQAEIDSQKLGRAGFEPAKA